MWNRTALISLILSILSLAASLVPPVAADWKTGLFSFSALSLLIGCFIYLFDWMLEKGPQFVNEVILQDYKILDSDGKITKVVFKRLVKVRHNQVFIGGNGWTTSLKNLKSYLTYDGSDKQYSVGTTSPVKSGNAFWWEERFNPPLKRGDKVWIVTEFEMENEFTQSVCSDNFHAYRPIGKLCFKVSLPSTRSAKRWWISARYLRNRADDTTIFESREETSQIQWSGPAKRGGIYFVSWEW